MSMIYVFYNKYTLEILTVLRPFINNIDINEFIESRLIYDDKFKNLTYSDIDYIIEDTEEYDFFNDNPSIYKCMYIDNKKRKLKFKLTKNENVFINTTYNIQKYKRDYTNVEINEMYEEDYINFNLKNIMISDNDIEFSFEYLKDLNIRTKMVNKRWKSFHNDPYLTESSQDKTMLGKSIAKIGTYYPILVEPQKSENGLYALEGSHRITSLKLLQMEGGIPEDFKIFCIHMPYSYQDIETPKMFTVLKNPILIRRIIEVYYGSEILNDSILYEKALSSIKEDGDKIINKYTYETYIYTLEELLSAVDSYPHWLRDLIHIDGSIFPSEIINKELKFKEWVNECYHI